MQRMVVTGATSMIGVATIEAAIANGVEVYAIVRNNTNRISRLPQSPLLHIVYGTLESLLHIQGLPNTTDVFYHFAWAGTSKAERDNPYIQEKNIQYTLDAVELAHKMHCSRFVYAGSQAEYGPVDGMIDDKTKFAPVLSYGISKYAAGSLSQKLCKEKGMEHILGRIFSVYGPHDNDGTMLDYAVKCWNNGEKAKFSAATQSWNYLYESDAGEMFYRLGLENVNPGTYLIANIESKILREYIEILMKVYGEKAKADFAPVRGGRGPVGLLVDPAKTMETLNYRPMVSFEEGIKEMIKRREHKTL